MTTRALVTNDDGIASEGIRALAGAAIGCGLDVVVAAPADEASGSSAALTAARESGRIPVEERSLEGLEGVSAYAVSAAPAFIALIATRGAFGPPPDVVLSGINRGANTGYAILHSGTVGAALTGRTQGCSGLAVSLDGSAPTHWETAAAVAGELLAQLLAAGEPLVLNLNVPDLPRAAVRGVRRARLARFGMVQMTVTEASRGHVQLGLSSDDRVEEHDPDTDAALLAAGYATVSVLQPICELDGPDLTGVLSAAPG